MVEDGGYPNCLKCDPGILLPLSDYGRDGAPIRYKAWVCSNPEVWLQHPDRQRGNHDRPHDRPELQVGPATPVAGGPVLAARDQPDIADRRRFPSMVLRRAPPGSPRWLGLCS